MTDTTQNPAENSNVQRLVARLSALEVRDIGQTIWELGEYEQATPFADKWAAILTWLRGSPEHARFFPSILAREVVTWLLFHTSAGLRDALLASLPHGAEYFLMSCSRIRDVFVRMEGLPDYDQVLLAAIEHYTVVSSATHPVEAIFDNLGGGSPLLIAIGQRLKMNLPATTFIARLLLEMERDFARTGCTPSAEYHQLVDKLVDYIASRPMRPEDNAAIAYRYALMGGVQVNGAGVPDWEASNRIGQVPKANYNAVLRFAVEQSGWFFATSWDDAGLRRSPDGQMYYRHNPDGWRQDNLLHHHNEVMLPNVPPVDAHRIGRRVRIQFHPVGIPTMEMLRQLK